MKRRAPLSLAPLSLPWKALPEGWTAGVARTHRLRMLGNAVVPQQAALALQLLTWMRTA